MTSEDILTDRCLTIPVLLIPVLAALVVLTTMAIPAQANTPVQRLPDAWSAGALDANPVPAAGPRRNAFATQPNLGLPLFLPAATYKSGGQSPQSIAVADLNGDGNADVVTANVCSGDCPNGSVSVLLGRGDGSFGAAVQYPSGGSNATSIVVADVNGDGKLDLVVANCGAANLDACQTGGDAVVGVLLGNGDGTFQTASVYDSGWQGAYSVVVADVNGDGKPDLLVAQIGGDNNGNGAVSVLLGNGGGTFRSAVVYQAGGWGTYSVAAGDVNGDGKPDLLVANACANPEKCSYSSAGVLLGNGDGTFQPVVLYDSGGASYTTVAVADLNHDGKLDLVLTTADDAVGSGGGSVSVLRGTGDGTFQPAVAYDLGGDGAWALVVADVNGDGNPDVVVAGGSTVSVLLGNGDGTLQGEVSYDSGGSSTDSVAMADVNGDALSDILVGICANSGCGNGDAVGVLLHIGTAPTATTLTSVPNPSLFGQFVTFSASVTSSFGTPAGTIMLFDRSTPLSSVNLVNGNVSIPVSTLAAGSHSITAVYQGSLKFNSSASAPLTQIVNPAKAATSTALVSGLNPSTYGQAITFTATVSSSGGAPPNGETVTFYNGLNVLGTAPMTAGIASLMYSKLPAGIFTITAAYPGDASFTASPSPGLLQVVDTKTQAPTSTTLASSLTPSTYGQKVTWTATVTTSGSTAPTGRVNFKWGSYSLGEGTLNSSGVATLTKSNLNADTYPLIAEYSGDAKNGPSTSAILNQVVLQTMSAATITSSANPSTQGQTVTFTAKITSPTVTPTGPVTFTAGKTVLGKVELSGGKATFTTSTLPVGSTTVTVTYPWNSDISGGSASVIQTVTRRTAQSE